MRKAMRLIRWTIVALLLAAGIATLVLGIVSYRRGIPADTMWINSAEKRPRVHLAVIEGTVHAVYSEPSAGARLLEKKQFGPFYLKRAGVGKVDAVGIGMPFWAPAVVLLILPVAAFLNGPVRRWSRRWRGRCVHCGYCLTGLTEPRCPECGRPAKLPRQIPEQAA
jgi:hypothetical protein